MRDLANKTIENVWKMYLMVILLCYGEIKKNNMQKVLRA